MASLFDVEGRLSSTFLFHGALHIVHCLVMQMSTLCKQGCIWNQIRKL